MRTISFQALFDAFASQARVGRSAIQPAEKEQMVGDLNAAALWLWEQETLTTAFPDMLTGKLVTLGAGGIIPTASIDNADFWSVWVSDPRGLEPRDRGRYWLGAAALGNGDVKVFTAAAGQTVFIIYKTLLPQWTDVEVLPTCSYSAGALVLSDGKVFRALYDDAPGSDLADTSRWAEVTLPQSLQRMVVLKANYERMRLGAVMPENAEKEQAELIEATDRLRIGVQNQAADLPWWQNFNR